MDARAFRWSDLEFFLATARGGSLAAAASAHGVDAATVHRRVGKLEAAMRTRLFDRSPRGYSLTAAGEDLLGYVLAMEEQAIVARRKLDARDHRLEGTVRLATVDDLAAAVLSPIVRAFRDHHRGVTIAMDIHTSFADLARQQADVAIRFGARPPEANVVAKHVSRVDVALYASRSYLKKYGRPMRLDEIAGHPIVRGDAGRSSMPMERVMDRISDPTKVAVRSNSLLVRLGAIRDGIGLGFLGCYMGDREKTLERLPFRLPDASSNLWMLIHVDMRRNARVRAFVEHTYAALTALRPMFAPLAAGICCAISLAHERLGRALAIPVLHG